MLWHLLGKTARRRIAQDLTLDEIRALNESFRAYRATPPAERRRIEMETRRLAEVRHGGLPAVFFTIGMLAFAVLFLLHLELAPNVGLLVRYQVFTPLFFGAVSPLACYLIPAYRLRNLFNIEIDPQSAAITFLALLGLIWTLVFIGLAETGPRFTATGLTLLILCAGAATAPLLEEIGFREVLPGMVGRPPHYPGHLLSGLGFAAAHVPSSLEMFALYLIAALFLSTVRLQTEGLLFPVLVHGLANVTILLL